MIFFDLSAIRVIFFATLQIFDFFYGFGFEFVKKHIWKQFSYRAGWMVGLKKKSLYKSDQC
jgi:hypothetical protein